MPNRSRRQARGTGAIACFVLLALLAPDSFPMRLEQGGQKARADVAAPREDANSLTAHRQLVQKAKSGRIDLYFLGDSITRRWGTSDAAYRPMLEHWKANFYGWNAGNFGWGADRTQNILWRIQNGELDSVNPKVIVLLAGTNNVGAGDSAEEVASGVAAIVAECKKRAPKATLVLTAILPRNDEMKFVPVINEANRRIAQLADGQRVRFLDVNSRLADPEGKLFDGMTVERLHLSVAGYEVWASGLRPILSELLGPRAKVDVAPPPTGDPSASPPP